jgi:hypothetical protein
VQILYERGSYNPTDEPRRWGNDDVHAEDDVRAEAQRVSDPASVEEQI